jgi:hypothetical protein
MLDQLASTFDKPQSKKTTTTSSPSSSSAPEPLSFSSPVSPLPAPVSLTLSKPLSVTQSPSLPEISLDDDQDTLPDPVQKGAVRTLLSLASQKSNNGETDDVNSKVVSG